MSRLLLPLSLLATAAASTAAAQGRAAPAEGAIVTGARAASGRVAHVPVFTLTWQDITIPARLAAATPAAASAPSRFVLTWEPLPAVGDEPRQVADRGTCRTMRLVLVPCE